MEDKTDALRVPKFIKCKIHDKPCYIKTGTNSSKTTFKKSYYICSNAASPCGFTKLIDIPALSCPAHSNEVIELQWLFLKSASERFYYYRCNIGKQNSSSMKWCGHQRLDLKAVTCVDKEPKGPNKIDGTVTASGTDLKRLKETGETVPVSVTESKGPNQTGENVAASGTESKGLNQSCKTTDTNTVVEKCDPAELVKRSQIFKNVQRNLECKQKIMTMVRLESLPDKGMKLKQEVKDLESALLEVKLSPVEEEQRDSHILKQAQSQQEVQQVQRLPANYLQQMYADRPMYKPLYCGSMNPSQRQEIISVTREAVEKLASSLETMPKEIDQTDGPKDLKIPLMNHQKHALAWLLWRETQHPLGGILADDMGLGKTLTMISLILKQRESTTEASEGDDEILDPSVLRAKTTLIICPASLMQHWANELKSKCRSGSVTYLIYHGSNRTTSAHNISSHDVVITTYETVRSDVPRLPKGDNDKIQVKGNKTAVASKKTKESPLLRIGFKRIILDEGHVIKNHKTGTSEAVCRLRAVRRWIVTGTPIHNRLSDVFSMLRFLRCSPFDEMKVWKYWVDNNTSEGQARLATIVKALMLRRKKDSLGIDQKPLVSLPEKHISDIHITLSEDEGQVYKILFELSKSAVLGYLQKTGKDGELTGSRPVAGGSVVSSAMLKPSSCSGSVTMRANVHMGNNLAMILTLLLRLRQCCCHLNLLEQVMELSAEDGAGDMMDDITKQLEEMNLSGQKRPDIVSNPGAVTSEALAESKAKLGPAFEQSFTSTKLSALMNRLKDLFSSPVSRFPVKCVVVSQWCSMLDIVALHLKKVGIKYLSIRGDIPLKQRENAVEEFNSEKSVVKVLLLSLRAGGVGLNLIGGNHLFLLDLHWNPAIEAQAFDRIHRVGQKQDVYIHRIICDNTIESRIVKLQEQKKSLAANILEGNAMKNNKLTLTEIRMLFNV